MYIRETIRIIEEMDISHATRSKLFQDNAITLLDLNI
jgi:hypothetical protein